MERDVVNDIKETAYHRREHGLGLTTTIFAVLAAFTAVLGHRAHTEEVIHQAKLVDTWSFYQAKHMRAHMYLLEAEKANAGQTKTDQDNVSRYLSIAIYEQCGTPAPKTCKSGSPFKGSVLNQHPLLQKEDAGNGINDKDRNDAYTIRQKGQQLGDDAPLVSARAFGYDCAEVCFELSIMLCGIALITEAKSWWRLSFLSAAMGVIFFVAGTMHWKILMKFLEDLKV